MGSKSSPARVRGANQLVTIRKLARALLDELQLLEGEQGHRAEPAAGEGEAGFYETVKAYEIFLIRRALMKSDGNRAQAGRLLGLKPTTLHQKMKAYDIKDDPKATVCGNGVVAGSCSGPGEPK